MVRSTTFLTRVVTVAFAILVAGAALGQTPATSGASPANSSHGATAEAPVDFSVHSFRLYLDSHPELLRPVRVFDLGYDRAVRLALWNDPLGRVLYNLAAEEAMLGRTGLVNGGRSLGAGLALTALGGAVSPLSGYLEVLMPSPGSSSIAIGARSPGRNGTTPGSGPQ